MIRRSRKSFVVVAGEGPPCPRCARPTQIREHDRIKAKHLRQPYYFTRWFYCTNARCKVTLHMEERFKVWTSQEPEPVSPQLELQLKCATT
jgi:hypothetical protein